MGWDNTTEMVATVVDSITHLTRQFVNVNSETPNQDPLMLVPRPYEAAVETVQAELISLAAFGEMMEETS